MNESLKQLIESAFDERIGKVQKQYPFVTGMSTEEEELRILRHNCLAWIDETIKPIQQELEQLPNCDIEAFWTKYKDAQIAKWDKHFPEGFNAFIMGYYVHAKETLAILDGMGKEEEEKKQ